MLLKHNFDGTIYPINPGRETLFGHKTFPSIEATPCAPEMVIMALPQAKVKDQVAACAARGVRVAIIITSKFSDADAAGAELEREIVKIANASGMRLIGPNCLGLISPSNDLVLCSSPALEVDRLIKSPIGFISQSGALMATLFDRAYEMGIGFTHCISVGNQADLELCDFVEFLIADPDTRVICTYIEGIKSPKRFVQLARRARAAGKPWLAVKAGKTAEGCRAAYSHTASMAGDFASLEAVCRQENVVLLDDPAAMLVLAAAMARYPGKRVDQAVIVTTSGGGGALSADRLAEAGIPLTRFSEPTREALSAFYPPGQADNPVDLFARRHEEVGEAVDIAFRTTEIAMVDPQADLCVAVMTTAPGLATTSRQLAAGAQESGKPLLFVMQPGMAANPARNALIDCGVPFTNSLGEAVAAVAGWRRWSAWRAAPEPEELDLDASDLPEMTGAADEFQSKALLEAIGVPVNSGQVFADIEEAVAGSEAIGFPLVAKVVSPDIVHKSDVGGVLLNVGDACALRNGLEAMRLRISATLPRARIAGFYLQSQEAGELELIVGIRRDPQFGPLVVIGSGGVMVEVLRDIAVLPAPVARETALTALRGLRIAPLLEAHRGRPPLDIDAVADVIVRMGWLAQAFHERDFEIEVNPLKVRVAGQGCVAVDARVRLD
ncbi:acyl-CoA synthetase [Cupriavidus sp. TA19]|nr:acyl-CoA synthetase [Cupriavidus sp. TA19]